MRPDEIAEKILLTPAEKGVLLEQMEEVKLSATMFARGVETKGGKALIDHLTEMTHSIMYVQSMLEHKIGQAAKAMYDESTKGEG